MFLMKNNGVSTFNGGSGKKCISSSVLFLLNGIDNTKLAVTDANITRAINRAIKHIIPACNSVCKLAVEQAFTCHPIETIYDHYNLGSDYVFKTNN